MRTLITVLAVLLLAGCASSYYPVYVSSQGDYYIAEDGIEGPYYAPGSTTLSDLGLYPWWSTNYGPAGQAGFASQNFMYYSPNFYPHYFSIWDVPPYYSYFGYYGYYGAYHPFWCPPYRGRHFNGPVHLAGGGGEENLSPDPPPAVYRLPVSADPEFWKDIENMGFRRDQMELSRMGMRNVSGSRSAGTYSSSSRTTAGPSRSSYSSPTTSSRGISSPSARRSAFSSSSSASRSSAPSRSSMYEAAPRSGYDEP